MEKTNAHHLTAVRSDLATTPVGPATQAMRKGVLLVEHEVPIRELLCEAMECRMIPYWTAGNVAEALDIAHSHGDSIGVVVLEQDFPEWNGALMWEVLRRLKRHLKGCLIVPDGVEWTPRQVAELGVSAIVHKPVQVDDLMRLVRDLTTADDDQTWIAK